jgi:hypothetical protein
MNDQRLPPGWPYWPPNRSTGTSPFPTLSPPTAGPTDGSWNQGDPPWLSWTPPRPKPGGGILGQLSQPATQMPAAPPPSAGFAAQRRLRRPAPASPPQLRPPCFRSRVIIGSQASSCPGRQPRASRHKMRFVLARRSSGGAGGEGQPHRSTSSPATIGEPSQWARATSSWARISGACRAPRRGSKPHRRLGPHRRICGAQRRGASAIPPSSVIPPEVS